ncbi:MAG: hypothetical protein ACKO37_03840 [Vampirovibrionales bacterium]
MSGEIKDARSFFKQIKATPDNFCIIHYSCENLNDENESLSPRITSVAILDYITAQSTSFSIHSTAELLKISKEEVQQHLNEIEKQLLTRFYDCIAKNPNKIFIHWDMQNMYYGFQHLEHRYEILYNQKPPCEIKLNQRVNLKNMLRDKYGDSFASHPRMKTLMTLNSLDGGEPKNFLEGSKEAEAFRNGEYVKMSSSTLSKVEFFRQVVEKASKNNLKTSSKNWEVWIEKRCESTGMKIFLILATTIGIPGSIIALIQYFMKQNP